MDRHIPAIRAVTEKMEKLGYSQRIEKVRNAIAFDWVIFLCGVVSIVISCSYDLLRGGRTLRNTILAMVDETHRDIFIIQSVSIFFSAGGILSAYSGSGYYMGISMYDTDFKFMFSLVYFFGALYFGISSFVICLSWRMERKRSS
jgi:hypothetical protein